MPSSDPLPLKENSLFKRAMKYYENRLYKNGLKLVNQILLNPVYCDHGESLALKGLLVYCMGRKEEAYELVRRGLRKDLKSFLCWNTYGILYRSDKNYEEAVKCFRNAVKCEPENLQILQDLSLLQVQNRDLEGYLETRHKLFTLAPTQRASWAGFAVAYHLNENYEMALKVLDVLRSTMTKTSDSNSPQEQSELLIYENLVLEESGDVSGALQHMIENQPLIRDKTLCMETIIRHYFTLNRHEEAEDSARQLLTRNPERIRYYNNLFKCLKAETDEDKFKILLDFSRTQPLAKIPRVLSLQFLQGNKFKVAVDTFLRRGIRKGVPPLFIEMRRVYNDSVKVREIEDLLLGYETCLKECGSFAPNEETEPPSTLLWTYYYLAQHFDHMKKYERALGYIDTVIEHTPTMVDAYLSKGKIWKHLGNKIEACKWMDEAQSLDTSDRFLNSKCAKYLLRLNEIDKAKEMMSRFTLESQQIEDVLSEMQCIWYLSECALVYERLGQWGDALQKCHEIDQYYSHIYTDQFDFHSYCLRGIYLKSYMKLLRMETKIRDHTFYRLAACCAIRVYLRLHDSPLLEESPKNGTQNDELTESELKKLKSKERKAKRRAAEDKRETKTKQKSDVKEIIENSNSKNHPAALERTEQPLEEAIKFLIPLKLYSSNYIRTYLLAFEVYHRKGKVLLMLQSIKRAYAIDSQNPELQEVIIRFGREVASRTSVGNLSSSISQVVDMQMKDILQGKSLLQKNQENLDAFPNRIPSVLHTCKAMYSLDKSTKNEALKLITRLDETSECVSIKNCKEVLETLKSGHFGQCEDEVELYLKKCQEKFPYATDFQTQTNKENLETLLTDMTIS